MVVGLIGVIALMAIKLAIVTALLQQMEDYPVLVPTEDCVQQNLQLYHVRTMYLCSCCICCVNVVELYNLNTESESSWIANHKTIINPVNVLKFLSPINHKFLT